MCGPAQGTCNNNMIGPYEETGLNPYDVRIPCEVPTHPVYYDDFYFSVLLLGALELLLNLPVCPVYPVYAF